MRLKLIMLFWNDNIETISAEIILIHPVVFFCIFMQIYFRGPLSTLHRAVHRASSKIFTVKSIDLQKYDAESGLTREGISVFP